MEDTSGAWYETHLKLLFGIVFIWLAFVNMGDYETAIFDKKQGICKLTRKNWFFIFF